MINWIIENYVWIVPLLLGVMELVLRYVPSHYNLSILDTIYRILNAFLPKNKKIGEGSRTISDERHILLS